MQINIKINPPGIGLGLTAVFSIACGLMVTNLYFAQAPIGEISPALGLHGWIAGLVVTLPQLGYGTGLVFVVSLADRFENKRLILLLTTGACPGQLGTWMAASAASFLLFSFLTGFCSVGAQIMVPLAAHSAPEHNRGRSCQTNQHLVRQLFQSLEQLRTI